MKISNDDAVIHIRSVLKSPADNQSLPKVNREKSNEDDHVQLSSKAKELQRIKDSLENVPEVRREKVAELKAACENGTYQPDSSKTAENILKESIIDLLL